jgi:SDR family mycofactocin-dependent oxidoreductase
MGLLDGKVAFITGVARGQGRAHALRLAREGADIVGIDICEQMDAVPYPLSSEADLKETQRLVEALGRSMIARKADVRSIEQQQEVFDEGVATFGHIDIVVANAGIVVTGSAVTDRSRVFKDGIDVMLTGVWNTLQVSYPHLVERGQGGAIVLTSSTAGLKAFSAGMGDDSYTAAKVAVAALAKGYAAFLGQHNIRVNAIAPTGVATTMILENPGLFQMLQDNPHLQNAMRNALPVEMLQPEDISEVVLFLVTDAGRYISGSTIAIDAGAMAM